MKKAERNGYSVPMLKVEELEVERGFEASFGVGIEDVGNLEELY